MEPERQIIAGGSSSKFNLAKFEVQKEFKFTDHDDSWFIRLKPEDKEKEEDRLRKNASIAKGDMRASQKNPDLEKEWILYSTTERYFRERLESDSSTLFFMVENAQGNFEAYPIAEHHVFKPIPKPVFFQSEEEKKIIEELKQDKKKHMKRLKDKIEKSPLLAGWQRDWEVKEEMSTAPLGADNEKGEGLDYEEPDEDEVVCTTDLKKKKVAETAEVKDIQKEFEDAEREEEEEREAAQNSNLGKRSRPSNAPRPDAKKVKLDKEWTDKSFIAFLRVHGPCDFSTIKKHFHKKNQKEEFKKWLIDTIPRLAEQENNKGKKLYLLKNEYQ